MFQYFREKKFVAVNQDKIVPYDILVLTPGQQFQRPDCPEPEIDDPNFITFKKNTEKDSSDAEKFSEFKYTLRTI
jgi:hypothetical protein